MDASERNNRRRLLLATSGLGIVGAAAAAYPFVASMEPSARALAAGAPVETDLGGIAEGQLQTVEWRGRPVWVLHRSPAMLTSLGNHDAQLADPTSDVPQQPADCRNANRSIKPEWFVCVGICTHLGCSPTLRGQPGELSADWPGGFFCPCHGSRFDLAGRVFKNVPAPTNLEIPPYQYLSPTRIRIGEEKKA